jgi:hypothetical protein
MRRREGNERGASATETAALLRPVEQRVWPANGRGYSKSSPGGK